MPRTRDPKFRCPRCRMHLSLCICALEPRLETRTHVVLILHPYEENKTSNTGRLAARCLPNSRVIVRDSEVEAGAMFPEGYQPVVLFPSPEARPIGEFSATGMPIALVVPDGTWRQATRTQRRISALDALPRVGLAGGTASEYRLRTAAKPGRVSTLEAIARALAVLENENGPKVQSELERIQRVMVDRTLWSSGRLQAGEVSGGIPAGAQSHAPWLTGTDS